MAHTPRYSTIAIALHWSIATGIVAMLISGLVIYQGWLTEATLFHWIQWHKSLGIVVLLLALLRFIWRLSHHPPQPQHELSIQQIRLANWGHWSLYLLLMAMPLSGWLMVSSSEIQVPTLIFNRLNWPHLPLPESWLLSSQTLSSNLHFYGAILLTLLILGHIMMVIKHHQQGLKLLDRMPLNRFSLGSCLLAATVIIGLSINTPQTVPAAQSHSTHTGLIRFSGVHADKAFTGQFNDWSLQANFNPVTTTLDQFVLRIHTASIATGNPFYDETLSESDWFDSAMFAELIFTAQKIRPLDNQQLSISGQLTVKGQQYPLKFVASINQEKITASFTVSRLALGLGIQSDPDAEWVDDLIQITAWSELITKKQ